MVSRKVSRCGAVLWRRVDDATALYDTRVGVVHLLNDSAAAVWALCDGTRTADGIVSALLGRFEVSRAVLSAAVRSTLKEFRARRLLEWRRAPRDGRDRSVARNPNRSCGQRP